MISESQKDDDVPQEREEFAQLRQDNELIYNLDKDKKKFNLNNYIDQLDKEDQVKFIKIRSKI